MQTVMENKTTEIKQEEIVNEEQAPISLLNCCVTKDFEFDLKDNGHKLLISNFKFCETLPLSDAVGLLDGSGDPTGMIVKMIFGISKMCE